MGDVEDVLERVKAIQARRAAAQAEKKARWDFYREQLAKSTPNQGGAHSKTARVFRIW